MAYDAGILNEEEKKGTVNVLQAQPLASVPQQEEGTPAPVGGSAQSATIQPTAAKPPKSSSPRSGLFTNIRQYIQRNQPKAQQLAQATSKALSKPSESVSQAVQQQQQQYRENISKLSQERQQAQQQAQDIVQRAATTGGIAEQDISRFQQLASGQQRFDQPADFNIQPVTTQLEKAKEFAAQSQTAPGRKELLRTVFGGDSRRYTPGQQSLDALLLQTTRAGREGLAEGLAQQTQAVEQQIQQAQQQAQQQQQQLTSEQQAMQSALQQLAGQKFGERQTQISSQRQQQLQNIQDLTQQAQAARDLYEGEISDIRGTLAGGGTRYDVARRLAEKPEQLAALGVRPEDVFKQTERTMYDFEDPTGRVNVGALKQQLRDDYGSLDVYNIPDEVVEDLRKQGVFVGENQYQTLDLKYGDDTVDYIRNQIAGKEVESRRMLGEAGIDIAALQGLQEGQVAISPEELARYNALAKLTGQQQLQRGTFEVDPARARLQAFIDRYRGGAY